MKRALLAGIAGATITLGTVSTASAAPLTLDSPAPVADSGSSNFESGSVGALVGVLPTGSTAAIGNTIGAAANIILAPLFALCTMSSAPRSCISNFA